MQLKKVGESAIAHAPAKLNLFLEISGKRDDGFHEIETLMTSVNLYDTLRFTSTSSEKIDFTCVWDHGVPLRQRTPLPQDRSNLVVRALEDLQQYVGKRRGAEVHLVKRIPAEAGMGGASSDAAAVLTVATNWCEYRQRCAFLFESFTGVLSRPRRTSGTLFEYSSPALRYCETARWAEHCSRLRAMQYSECSPFV
jgi:hypothetical protein